MSVHVGEADVKSSTTRDSAIAAVGAGLVGVGVGRLINLTDTLTLALAVLCWLVAFVVAWPLRPSKQTASRIFIVGFAAAVAGFLFRIALFIAYG